MNLKEGQQARVIKGSHTGDIVTIQVVEHPGKYIVFCFDRMATYTAFDWQLEPAEESPSWDNVWKATGWHPCVNVRA